MVGANGQEMFEFSHLFVYETVERLRMLRGRMFRRNDPKEEIRIRSGSGLGDGIYLYSIVKYLANENKKTPIKVFCKWKDVFLPLGDRITVEEFSRAHINTLAHYSMRKQVKGTNQFEDMWIQAGIDKSKVKADFDWTPTIGPKRDDLVPAIKEAAKGKPILCVRFPTMPMGRKDNFAVELLPQAGPFIKAVARLKQRFFVVQIGSGKCLTEIPQELIDIDFAGKTTLPQMFDIAYNADAFFGQCSFIIPLSEGMAKPGLICFSERGMKSRDRFISSITPEKIIHRKDILKTFIDTDSEASIFAACDSILP